LDALVEFEGLVDDFGSDFHELPLAQFREMRWQIVSLFFFGKSQPPARRQLEML